ncbi:uncharacterized protein LOC123508891 [Portunus trituberculatus]|uniref:uncharacterized protein LOC123508891 n=1 Tax=Portunus trituberculatus TaxID=210409 RepID=UPI001E1CBB30|nr:uncharacterized protein LOC123508891 [Portunus trituberculatus]
MCNVGATCVCRDEILTNTSRRYRTRRPNSCKTGMAELRAWAVVVVWVVSLASHAHGQLGVWGVDEDTESLDTPTTTASQLLPDIYWEREGEWEDEGNAAGREESGVVVRGQERRWRPLLDTYQGCYDGQVFNGTLMYVNLTQVMENNQLEGAEQACFHLCSNKKPLSSMYIAVSPAVSSVVDGCGCQEALYLDNLDGEKCDTVQHYYRVYCGPANDECMNHGTTLAASSLLLGLPLAALLHSLVTSYDV